jgi:hypothetical protein
VQDCDRPGAVMAGMQRHEHVAEVQGKGCGALWNLMCDQDAMEKARLTGALAVVEALCVNSVEPAPT